MELITIKKYEPEVFKRFEKHINEGDFVCFASEAAEKMEFKNSNEYHKAIKSAMELCLHAGLSIENNFRQVYSCSIEGRILFDWKLSSLAYYLVCMNGETTNPKVAKMQIELLINKK